MIIRLKKYISASVLFVLIVGFLVPLGAPFAVAQTSLSLSVTPPLFQFNFSPGEKWTGTLRLVNTNPYEITLYASPVTFTSNNERGHAEFIPLLDVADQDEYSPGNWIEIIREPIKIPRESSREIEFSINVPENAGPGGHYAAILVGTTPLEGDFEGATVRVAGFVSSLILISVKGDVVQRGNVREFITGKTWYHIPDVDFKLRFENFGNVHIRPEGEIVIYNMWGKERGRIPINQKTHFGNILPGTTRAFNFNWKGEENFFESGRYKATLELNYGDGMVHGVKSETFFWVIPIVPVLSIVGIFITFLFLAGLIIRAYIRRVLLVSQRTERSRAVEPPAFPFSDPTEPIGKTAREEESENKVVDLRGTKQNIEPRPTSIFSSPGFFAGLKTYFGALVLVLLVLSSLGVFIYFKEVLLSERTFEIVVLAPDGNSQTTIRSEGEVFNNETTLLDDGHSVVLLSGGGDNNLLATTRLSLEEAGLMISFFGNAGEPIEGAVLVRYPPDLGEMALRVKEILGEEAVMEVDETLSEVTVTVR